MKEVILKFKNENNFEEYKEKVIELQEAQENAIFELSMKIERNDV